MLNNNSCEANWRWIGEVLKMLMEGIRYLNNDRSLKGYLLISLVFFTTSEATLSVVFANVVTVLIIL